MEAPKPNDNFVATTGATRIDDPNVKIPKAVKQIAAAADQLHAQAYANPEVANQDPPAGDPPPAAQDAAAPSPAPAPQPSHDDWEHKFNSVNGRYTKSQQTIQNLNARISDLESALATRDSRPAPTTQPTVKSELTEQEIQDYGAEFLDVVGKKAREIAAAENASLREELANLRQQLSGVTTSVVRNDRQKMMSDLDADVKDWRQINENPEFMTWLGLKDPYSGLIRHDMLKIAWNANDTSRVKNFFNGFITDEAATTPRPQPAPTSESKPQLAQFAAPGRASSSGDAPPSPTSNQKPIITRAQIAQFHSDRARGKYRGREAEANAFDIAMIDAAREGRIR